MQNRSAALLLSLVIISAGVTWVSAAQSDEKAQIVSEIKAAGVDTADLTLIEANLEQLTVEQLTEIQRFMMDQQAIADSRWFDVSQYADWNDYNYNRPVGDTILTMLARRDLFLDPARQLNNHSLTNMSAEALAALTFSQTYVEEKWDHIPPWDGDPNPIFNWIHPDLLNPPDLSTFAQGDYLHQERLRYLFENEWIAQHPTVDAADQDPDMLEALRGMRPPYSNAPRLAGFSYPLGNQLYLQTAETVYWYVSYLKYGQERYGVFEPQTLDTRIPLPQDSNLLMHATAPDESTDPLFVQYPGLWELFHVPFAYELRRELMQPETAGFWNVMRYVYAGARQREGGGSPEHPENNQPPIMALRYSERTAQPVGRPTNEISAFALLTTVYSDSILLDFTNWDFNQNKLLIEPTDTDRADGINRLVSERNKAIQVIEQMGNELAYPNATHIAGSRGLGINLTTQYEDPVEGDFLPYTAYEAQALTLALVSEATEFQITASRMTLCGSPLLKAGYEAFVRQISSGTALDWIAITGTLCN